MNGLDCRVLVSSHYNDEDDAIGGAVLTGTVLFEMVAARIEDVPTEMQALLQGIITDQGYYVSLYPASLGIENNYTITVQHPHSHPLYGIPLRIRQVTRTSSSRTDRGHIELLVDKIHEDH